MVTLSLHILATKWTGISWQSRKSRSSVTLVHSWRVITFDWHVKASSGTFHLLCHNLAVDALNKVTGGKAAAVSLWIDCVESYMICKTLWHTTGIINSTAVTTLNVSLSTRSAVSWVCVRLQRNVSFNWSTKISQTTMFVYLWYLVSRLYLADLKCLDWFHQTGENLRWSRKLSELTEDSTKRGSRFDFGFFSDSAHHQLKTTLLALTATLQRFMGLETETQFVQAQVAKSFNTTHIENTLKNRTTFAFPHTNHQHPKFKCGTQQYNQCLDATLDKKKLDKVSETHTK